MNVNPSFQLFPPNVSRKVPEFGSRTFVMGIVNVTPDSFSGDGLAADPREAVARGLRMIEEGADIIDVGGESTRPGAASVTVEEELRRVLPVIERLREKAGATISIDTYKSAVARAAVRAGATIINDISALQLDADMAAVAAETGASLVLMHMQGTPQTMQRRPEYKDVVREIIDCLRRSIQSATQAGVLLSRIIVDPGIGFGKTVEHNLEILRRLSELRELRRPILVGPSRKSFIGKVLDLPVDQRLEGTAASVALAIAQGADIVRVHDVKTMVRVARMCDAIVRGGSDAAR